jgi:hypothetical protein
MKDEGYVEKEGVTRVSTVMPATITFAFAASAVLFLILFSTHPFNYQMAYSQMNLSGSQNFPSLLKNLLGPQKEVTGHYNNPQFGITDIVFPEGWTGRELPPILGLTVLVHPTSKNNESSSLFGMSSAAPFAQPQMILQILNNSDLASLSSEMGNAQGFSISKVCKPLAQDTTSVIDGRTFNVATLECPLSSLIRAQEQGMSPTAGNNQSNIGNDIKGGVSGGAGGLFKSLNLNPNAIMQTKLYEFKTADKTYRLGLIVSNLASSASQTSERPDISKYIPLLDSTANTLKFR